MPHYATIQSAVDASAAGGTVLVCPGMYPEQITINQPIILKGVINGTAGAAVITVPSTGLIPNVTTPTYGSESAQLLIQNFNGAQAQISNIAIDGSDSTCPTDVPGGATRTVGIKLFNVGSRSSSGALIQGVSVRDQVDGCGLGEGIDLENSYVTIDSSEIHDVDRHGIVQVGGSSIITNNTLSNCAAFGATWGISLSGATRTTVSFNQVSAQRGVQLDAGTTGVYFVSNIIGPFTTTGLYLNRVSGNHIWFNRISASYTALWLSRSSGNDVLSNFIRLQTFGIVDENSGGGNTIASNTMNEGSVCLWVNGTSGDVLSSNTFQNCAVTTQTVP
jgi:parallel beta-helix repeat protein